MGEEARKTRIVLDTNNYISALGWSGKESALFKRCLAGDFDLFISRQIFDEVERVLSYPRFSFIEDDKREYLQLISSIAKTVEPHEKLTVIKADPSDNALLECAVESEADYLISGDRHLLDLKEYRGTRVLRASEFLELMRIG